MAIDQSLVLAYKNIKNELSNLIDNQVFFEEFVLPSKIINVDKNCIYILVKNSFAKSVLNTDYLENIKKSLNLKLNTKYDVVFVDEQDQFVNRINDNLEVNKVIFENKFNINENYTFNNLIVDNFNKTAVNAAKSILEDKKYNPIFIYGGIGLGKTHILHAVGNEYAKKNKKVRYISSDDFVREIYNGLLKGGKEIEKIKEKFQDYDLLLVDDVQFLANKDKINEIFFNIFNHNISSNRLIIMTCDKNPEHLNGLEERMKSRFLSGLFVKIDFPNFETMKKILLQKIGQINSEFIFSDDAVNFIVNRNIKDIRKLEGYLNKIIFFATNNLENNNLITQKIIQEFTNEENDEIIKSNGYDVNPNLIIDQISQAYSVSPEIVKSKSRVKSISIVRSVCMYVLRDKFKMSFSQIGNFFSGRDHSTVMDSIKKIDELLKKDQSLKVFLETLYKKI